MTDKNKIQGHIEYSLEQFCRATGLNRASVCELVGQGVIEPKVEPNVKPHVKKGHWYFSEPDIIRSLKAKRLQQDLETNLEGAALAVELLELNNALRQRVSHLEALLGRMYNR